MFILPYYLKITNQKNLILYQITKCRNAARRELRRLKKSGDHSSEHIKLVASKFFDLVRSHSKMKRISQKIDQKNAQRSMKSQCHRHFWQFSKELLDDKTITQSKPEFSAVEATQYFSNISCSQPHQFSKPSWIPSAHSPTTEFDSEEISMEEVSKAIKKAKSVSTPSPYDAIPYIVYQKCPSLSIALLSLFNLCWSSSSVPVLWKTAAIKLIPKDGAAEDPGQPSNFRPIALTPSAGKLFSTILRNRWLSFMIKMDTLTVPFRRPLCLLLLVVLRTTKN